MATITLEEAQALPEGQDRDWAYNALDCTGTLEIAQELIAQLSGNQLRTYQFESSLQAPALSMMSRGVRVDQFQRDEYVKELKRRLTHDNRDIQKQPLVSGKWDGTEIETGICPSAFGKRHSWPRGVPDGPDRRCKRCGASRVNPKPFSATSPAQCHHLIYELHDIPEYTSKAGNISTDDDTLERIAHKHPDMAGLVEAILSIRNLGKQIGTLSARLGTDGRYYSSFNVGAAWTGRFSSSKNPFGLGGNLQNVAPNHRRMFLADPGMEIGYADYKQGESNIVAHLSGDPKYIEAHRVGDVHTYVARLVWPELPWTGDLKRDKKIAKQNLPWDDAEGHDYRDCAKKIQHGSNYGRTPYGISLAARIPLAQAKEAYEKYMSTFDYIPAWHNDVRRRVLEHIPFVNPLGREWMPLGRPWDKHTWRQALSFVPQSLLADILNIAMWRIWKNLEPSVQCLAQVHDAILHQFPSDEITWEWDVLKCMEIPTPVTDIHGQTRLMTIGVETATGKNWGHKSANNPHGIDEAPMEAYLRDYPL